MYLKQMELIDKRRRDIHEQIAALLPDTGPATSPEAQALFFALHQLWLEEQRSQAALCTPLVSAQVGR